MYACSSSERNISEFNHSRACKHKDLLKHMPPENPDFQAVGSALDRVLEVASYLDVERGKADGLRQVLVIQDRLVGKEKLVSPSRYEKMDFFGWLHCVCWTLG